MSERVLIQYRYPGTTNGREVGEVYVTRPLFAPQGDTFSHTYRVADAIKLSEREAAKIAHKWARNGARLVPESEAHDLEGV